MKTCVSSSARLSPAGNSIEFQSEVSAIVTSGGKVAASPKTSPGFHSSEVRRQGGLRHDLLNYVLLLVSGTLDAHGNV